MEWPSADVEEEIFTKESHLWVTLESCHTLEPTLKLPKKLSHSKKNRRLIRVVFITILNAPFSWTSRQCCPLERSSGMFFCDP